MYYAQTIGYAKQQDFWHLKQGMLKGNSRCDDSQTENTNQSRWGIHGV